MTRRSPFSLWARRYWWAPVVITLLAALTLGYIGFSALHDGYSTSDNLYRTLQLIGLESGSLRGEVPWELQIARFVAPIGAILGAIGLVGEAVQAVRSRDWQLRSPRAHVVICGLGSKGVLLARAYAAAGERVVAIERDPQPSIQREFEASGIDVIKGSALSVSDLRRAGAPHAARVIAAVGDDRDNAEVLALSRDIAFDRREGDDLVVDVHIFDRELKTLLGPIFEAKPGFRAAAFNTYEAAASALRDSGLGRRVMIIGFGALGESLVLALEAKWSEALGQSVMGEPDALPVVTIVDRNASPKLADLLDRHPHLRALEIEPIDMDVEAVAFETGEFLRRRARELESIVVCFGDDGKSVITALTAAKVVAEEEASVRILARVESTRSGFATLLDGRNADDLGVEAFSAVELGSVPSAILAAESLARHARVTFDTVYDRLLIARVGELVDDQLAGLEEVAPGIEIARRGSQGPIVGAIVQPLHDPSLGLDIDFPLVRWDVPLLGLEDSTLTEIVAVARERFGEESTRDAQLFHEAVEAPDPETASMRWRDCLAAGDPKAHFGLAYTLYGLAQFREAFVHAEKYARLAPENVWAWTWAGRSAEAIEELETARRLYERAVRVEQRTHVGCDAAELYEAMEVRLRWSELNREDKASFLFGVSDAIDKAGFLDLEPIDERNSLVSDVEQRWMQLSLGERVEILLWGPEWRATKLVETIGEQAANEAATAAAGAWVALPNDARLDRLRWMTRDDVEYVVGTWESDESAAETIKEDLMGLWETESA